jgi:Mat/Ecp fimbriae major subunit
MNKKLILSLVLFFSINQSFAADRAGDIRARVIKTISVAQASALNFGSFASSAAEGTINQAGVATDGVTAISSGETRSAGIFSIAGESTNDTPYTFALPNTATIGIGGSDGANQMNINLTLVSGGTTLVSGSDTATINGVLTVATNQPAGLYTGTYDVTASY